MKYLLDANAVIGLLGGNAGLLARVRQHVPEDFGVSAIAVHSCSTVPTRASEGHRTWRGSMDCNSWCWSSTRRMPGRQAKSGQPWPPLARQSARTTF